MDGLIGMSFQTPKLAEIRDFFVFQCFTGYSYAEVKRLNPEHSFTGIDGKRWMSIHRLKTGGEETIPLLPLPLDILQKYEDHPTCVRRRTLLPIPSCEDYNRLLKLVAELAGIRINLTTHTGRYYFANEVTYNNGAQLKTVSRLLGHKSINSTAKYVKGNRKHIADTMAGIQEILFTEDGQLRTAASSTLRKEQPADRAGARVVPLRAV
jgi:integrase